jgi:hypothetical protein
VALGLQSENGQGRTWGGQGDDVLFLAKRFLEAGIKAEWVGCPNLNFAGVGVIKI